jgi:hypothetical protein
MKILLNNLLDNKSYTDAGYDLFRLADQALSSDEIVVIDMNGVGAVPTLLMNTSFGNLIAKYGMNKTRQSFRFNNITKPQIERMKKYFRDYQLAYDPMG